MGAREVILSATVPEEEVTVAGEVVTVRGLTTAGRDEYERAAVEGESFRARLIRATCYLNGEPLFKEEDDLGAVPSHVTEPLIDAAIRLAAITTAELEDLEKN